MTELAQNVCLFHPSSTTCHIQKVRKTKLASLVPAFGNESVDHFFFYHRFVSWRLKHLASLNLYVVPMWTWWRHQMETFSALLALCAGNSPVTDEFPLQRPLTRSFDVFFDLRLSKRLSKHSWDWWFETLSRPLLRHCNGISNCQISWSLEASKLGLDVSNCSQICKNEPTVKFQSDMVISMQI